MSATYSSTLGTNNLYWVRFLINDTDTTSPLLQDEEITAVIADQLVSSTGTAVKYYAAADCLSVLLSRWMSAGKGIREKMVSKLKVQYGGDASIETGIKGHIERLRLLGAERTISGSRVLKVSPRVTTY